MRVLHVNSYYQTGPFYKNLFDRQAALGDRISVYMPAPKGFDPSGRDFGPYTFMDLNHHRLDRLSFHLKQYKMLRGALRHYAPGEFDVIHAHSLLTNGGIAWSLSKRLGIPYVVAVRDTDVNVLMRRMPHLRPLARRILEGASKVIFLSQSYRDRALLPYLSEEQMARVREKSAVVPNGVDALWLSNPPAPRTAPNPDEIRLLFVGQLIARKNLPAAIRAAEALSARGRKVKLTVVGQPADEKVVAQAMASPLVELLPPRPMAELMPLYRSADVFLLPSGRETFGLVYAEAISQGLPVLYTRGQGFDGQFPDGEVGFAIDPDDPGAIADKIEAILADLPRFSRAALEGSLKFDWDGIAIVYATIYDEVAGQAAW
jgi:glycosyltransferase involved in cell wall biosynthesis